MGGGGDEVIIGPNFLNILGWRLEPPVDACIDMIITKDLLDELSARAKASARLRCSFDLRNSEADGSQRMLNAIEPGTVMPIHRHMGSSETCVCIRGHIYDFEGGLTDAVDMVPGGAVLNIEKGQWHSLRCLESGTVLLEEKDGRYRPLGEGDVMEGAIQER